VTNPEELYISQEDLARIQTQISEVLSDLNGRCWKRSWTGKAIRRSPSCWPPCEIHRQRPAAGEKKLFKFRSENDQE
jgi:hypothetical protein